MATSANKLSALKTAHGPAGKASTTGRPAGKGSATKAPGMSVFKTGNKSMQMAHTAMKTAPASKGRVSGY